MTILVRGLLGPLLVTGGYAPAAPAAPLLPTATFTAVEIKPPAPPSPFAIDPDRTTEL
jgi:hypothetical protein